jgi:uncharacterized membrane protein HdeD (DUF308 family)
MAKAKKSAAATALADVAAALPNLGAFAANTPSGKDYLMSAVFALVLGLLFLAVPLDEVSAVGFFGAYLALSGVHLGIAAASVPKAK